ncbi:MAG: pseudouridine synthase [Cellvibrionaceae bacterium]|nr:pseudouridine synthase [Cellvibrionaceae bacterium]
MKKGEQQPSAPVDEKLQKVLARAGFGSRREMERAIAEGRVRLNGEEAKLGDRAGPDDRVSFDGRRVSVDKAQRERPRVLLYNKPEGEICSRKDPEGRRTVYERLPKLKSGRWISVGRLDFNTSGLLLFTDDGDLANKLMHPSSVIDREYLVRIQGQVDEDMKQRLREGIMLDDGPAKFTDIVDGPGEGKNRWFYCVVMEGRNREVRRLWESQGVNVSRLKRVRFGNIFIPSHVRVGQWIELDDGEVSELAQTAGLEATLRLNQSKGEKAYQQRHQKRLRAGKGRRPHHFNNKN